MPAVVPMEVVEKATAVPELKVNPPVKAGLAAPSTSCPVLLPVKERGLDPLIAELAPKVNVLPLVTLMLLALAVTANVVTPLPAFTPKLMLPPPINEMMSVVPFAFTAVLLRVNVRAVVPEALASIAIVVELLKLSVSAVKEASRVVSAGDEVLLKSNASVVAGTRPEVQSVPTFQLVPA